MQTLFITGGSGFIGSHTLLELAKLKHYKIVVFDNLRNGHKEAIDIIRQHTGTEIELIVGDLLNYSEIESAIQNHTPDIAAVIHFAALIEAGISVQEPLRFYENNIVGSINLLKAMQKHNVRKIVFSSTAAVYGTPTVEHVTESTSLNPESPYGSSKLMVEEMLRYLATEHVIDAERIDSVILRYFNAAGANPELLIGQDYPRPTHLMTVAIQAALGLRDKLTIFGNDYDTPDGTCIRDYIHVEDLASAHVAALNFVVENSGSEVINIGTGKGSSNLELVKLVEKIHGPFAYEFGPRRPGDPTAYYADNTKAKNTLGWSPKYSLEETVQHAYNWAKTYPKGFADKV